MHIHLHYKKKLFFLFDLNFVFYLWLYKFVTLFVYCIVMPRFRKITKSTLKRTNVLNGITVKLVCKYMQELDFDKIVANTYRANALKILASRLFQSERDPTSEANVLFVRNFLEKRKREIDEFVNKKIREPALPIPKQFRFSISFSLVFEENLEFASDHLANLVSKFSIINYFYCVHT